MEPNDKTIHGENSVFLISQPNGQAATKKRSKEEKQALLPRPHSIVSSE